jgi:hypothetical protein
VRAARDAGFEVEVVGPWIHPTFTDAHYVIAPHHTAFEGFRSAARHAARRGELTKRARLWWKNYVAGTAVYLIGTKPG